MPRLGFFVFLQSKNESVETGQSRRKRKESTDLVAGALIAGKNPRETGANANQTAGEIHQRI